MPQKRLGDLPRGTVKRAGGDERRVGGKVAVGAVGGDLHREGRQFSRRQLPRRKSGGSRRGKARFQGGFGFFYDH